MRHLLFILFSCSLIKAFTQQRPNIIYIMSDDHDRLAISAYNKTLIQTPNIDRIAREGVRFDNAFVGNSICGPARATLLTGQHSHKNGMINNRIRFDSSKNNVAKLLREAGYQTAIVGKWHLHTYPSGFDYWNILPGQGLYFDPRLISMKGDTSTFKGYATDVITNQAITWLDSRDKAKPFMLFLHHKAPHRNFVPPLKYVKEYHNKKFPEPPTLYEDTAGHGTAWSKQTMSILHDMKLSADLKVDPSYLMDIPWLKPAAEEITYYHATLMRVPADERAQIKEIYKERGELLRRLKPKGKELLKYKYQWYMQDYLACVASLDENIGRVLNYLDKNGLTKNTLVIYTSDQGMFLGQNGWFDKRWMYDVSMRTPLVARWPGHIKPKSVATAMVQNIDYAPSFLQIANAKIPGWMQGTSLAPLMTGKQKMLPRHNLYYHYYEDDADHTVLKHLGVRGERYKLIYFYTVNEWELYDLKMDPNERKNLINSPAHRSVLDAMKKELLKQRDLYDDHGPAGELK